jgi:hypothetical protein
MRILFVKRSYIHFTNAYGTILDSAFLLHQFVVVLLLLHIVVDAPEFDEKLLTGAHLYLDQTISSEVLSFEGCPHFAGLLFRSFTVFSYPLPYFYFLFVYFIIFYIYLFFCVSDTICDLGGASELANYGEYSGAPSEMQTYEYAKTVLGLMTDEVDPRGTFAWLLHYFFHRSVIETQPHYSIIRYDRVSPNYNDKCCMAYQGRSCYNFVSFSIMIRGWVREVC